MFAIVEIAGFQEKVSKGEKLTVPLLPEKEGGTVTFNKVLLLSADGNDVKIGKPHIAGAAVEVKIVGHVRGEKIRVYKMRRRKRYRRTHGHKQDFTEVEVMKITG